MREIAFREALREAMQEEMRKDDRVFLMGEEVAEYNGAYTSVFKNLFDWMSRHVQKTFMGKPMLLMATSTGGRGGTSVLEMAHSRFPYHDAKIAAEFSLPLFKDTFDNGRIIDLAFDSKLKEAAELFQKEL